jgi:mannose-phosphate isomerase/GDPmannose pyrophosphorylase family protein/mannose-6-phosphate isomerase
MRWSDVGSWNSLWEFLPHSEEGNVVRGDVVLSDTKNSYIHSESPLVTASGIEDLVIVATKDAVFVSRRDGTQGVKNMVETPARQERFQAIQHLLAHRPWGTCDDLASGPQFQVQQVVVKPGEKLPLQLHHKRAEH